MYKIEIFNNEISDELKGFMRDNKNSSIFQSDLWANFNKNFFNRKCFFVCIKDQDNNILLYSLIFEMDISLNKSYLYAPMGPIFNFNKNRDVFNFFMDEIDKLCEKEKFSFFRCEPQISYESVNENVLNAYDDLCKFFIKDNNFISSKEKRHSENTLILNLEKDIDEIFSNMKEKGRYNTRKAIKNNVKIKKTDDINSIEFEKFYELMEKTTKRNNFYSNNKNYYKELMKELKGNVLLYSAEKDGKILASAITTFYGDKSIYYYGASTSCRKDRKFMAPYLLQFEMIKDAKKKMCRTYDFLGISPEVFEINDKFYILEGLKKMEFSKKEDVMEFLNKHKFKGITDFKNKFNGETKNLIGSIDKIYDRKIYFILNFAKKLRKRIRKISGFKI